MVSIQRKIAKFAHDPSLLADKLGSYTRRWQKSRLDLARERAASVRFLDEIFGRDAAAVRAEYRGSPFKSWYDERARELGQRVGLRMTSSDFDIETIYLLVRLARPRVIVETGVLYGATTAHILEALRLNGAGRLISIDLPKAEGDLPQDYLIPADLRAGWDLILGDSKLELPALLGRLGRIDHFHHDSLHTYGHMLWEYTAALPHLAPGGIISSHDVISGVWRSPFKDFCARHRMRYGIFRNVGIATRGTRLVV